MRANETGEVSTCIDDKGDGEGNKKDGQMLGKEAFKVGGEGAEGETDC